MLDAVLIKVTVHFGSLTLRTLSLFATTLSHAHYNAAAVLYWRSCIHTLALRLCARGHRPFRERMRKWMFNFIRGEWSSIGGVTEQMQVRIPGQWA